MTGRSLYLLSLLLGLLPAATLRAESVPYPTDAEGFAIPQPGKSFTFPRDHGSHPQFRIEWWYLVGHLFTDNGRRFGYQATFFRNARPPQEWTESTTPLVGENQFYLAHMALSDPANERHLHEERLQREGWDAGAATDRLDLFNGNWSLQMVDDHETMELVGSIRGEAAFTLTLTPTQPLVLFGEGGLSRKGPGEAASSYYLTYPRLATTGTLRLGEQTLAVAGESWMDHEISSNQLTDEQVGWDWICMQLDDGREVKAFVLRHEDGSIDPYSTFVWIDRDGTMTHYGPEQFTWVGEETWTSPVTGGTYPVAIALTAPDPATGEPVTLRYRPLLTAQEIGGDRGGIAYWEGAGDIFRDDEAEPVGRAYLEMTGYAGSIGDQL